MIKCVEMPPFHIQLNLWLPNRMKCHHLQIFSMQKSTVFSTPTNTTITQMQ